MKIDDFPAYNIDYILSNYLYYIKEKSGYMFTLNNGTIFRVPEEALEAGLKHLNDEKDKMLAMIEKMHTSKIQ